MPKKTFAGSVVALNSRMNGETRNPAKKYIGRTFSPERIKKIAGFERINRDYFDGIMQHAEGLLKKEFPPGSRIIFVGQGMRPLFEAYRALNEIYKARPRNFARYFVAPNVRKNGVQIVPIAEQFENLKIVSGGVKNYHIVDSLDSGSTYRAISGAILRINPRANVSSEHQVQLGVGSTVFVSGEGIVCSESLPHPTSKSDAGRLSTGEGFARWQYLVFEQMLQDYVNKLMLARQARNAP